MNAAEPDHGPSKVPTASTRSYGSVSSECCPTFDIIPNHLQKLRKKHLRNAHLLRLPVDCLQLYPLASGSTSSVIDQRWSNRKGNAIGLYSFVV
ncbi:Hexokinase [Trichinella spiralis]|uniref:Hexokinase n=1 Tax=Trichinella spiralis TaxID=6334 RepID=A0ABR3KXL1_TRISP